MVRISVAYENPYTIPPPAARTRMISRIAIAFVLFPLVTPLGAADIDRIWLTHQTTNPSRVMVSWETEEPTDSVRREAPSLRVELKNLGGETLDRKDFAPRNSPP